MGQTVAPTGCCPRFSTGRTAAAGAPTSTQTDPAGTRAACRWAGTAPVRPPSRALRCLRAGDAACAAAPLHQQPLRILRLRDLAQALQHEASFLASLRHPNVTMFLGVCLTPPAVVTEYCAMGEGRRGRNPGAYSRWRGVLAAGTAGLPHPRVRRLPTSPPAHPPFLVLCCFRFAVRRPAACTARPRLCAASHAGAPPVDGIGCGCAAARGAGCRAGLGYIVVGRTLLHGQLHGMLSEFAESPPLGTPRCDGVCTFHPPQPRACCTCTATALSSCTVT